MGDGIGGPVVNCLAGDTFEMLVTHYRKDNQEHYDKYERVVIAQGDNTSAQYQKSKTDLEKALKGKFVTCNVRYRDKKTDALICNIFIQNPPEDL